MNILRYKARVLAGLATTLIAAFVMTVNYTDACRLQTVVLDGAPVNDWHGPFDMLKGRSVARQPFDSLARAVLTGKDVFRVNVSCRWPHTLRISTNVFSPVCLLVDRSSGDLWGVIEDGRVVPLDNALVDWECPVLTGTKSAKPFELCEDSRVTVVVAQLEAIRSDSEGLFHLLEEIDLGASDCIRISVSGLPYRLKARANTVAENLRQFVDFIAHYGPDLSEVRELDVRFADMIISIGGAR